MGVSRNSSVDLITIMNLNYFFFNVSFGLQLEIALLLTRLFDSIQILTLGLFCSSLTDGRYVLKVLLLMIR